jgi:hypothetical protein
VHHDEVCISDDRSWFILEGRRQAPDKIEQTLTTRLDMRAVLNVVRGPVALGGCVIRFVEERVKPQERVLCFSPVAFASLSFPNSEMIRFVFCIPKTFMTRR